MRGPIRGWELVGVARFGEVGDVGLGDVGWLIDS